MKIEDRRKGKRVAIKREADDGREGCTYPKGLESDNQNNKAQQNQTGRGFFFFCLCKNIMSKKENCNGKIP